MKIRKLRSRLASALGSGRALHPIAGYPSSVVDSYGCEFGFEMYYHLGYAYHLHLKGHLTRTVSCRDTRCFYWFSPDHVEKYDCRRWVPEYPCIEQKPHKPPALNRWTPPDFRLRYDGGYDFGFRKPLLLVFNKFNGEWNGPPINFLSKEFLISLLQATEDRYQLIYFRPTSEIVADESEVYDLEEKECLRRAGVVLVEELCEKHRNLSFNELQLHLISQSDVRISVQGGATYMNSLLPGDLYVLHRRGEEMSAGTYGALERLAIDQIQVFDDEREILTRLNDRLGDSRSSHAA